MFDAYQRMTPDPVDPPDIAIVDIDADSVNRFGQWPWSRDRLADLIARVSQARAIGVDILLLDADRVQAGDPDGHLAKAFAGAPVVLAAGIEPPGLKTGSLKPPERAVPIRTIVQSGPDAAGFTNKVDAVAWPLPAFTDTVRGVGLAIVYPEPDGVVRRIPGLYAKDGVLLPGFALEVLRVALAAETIRVHTDATGVRDISVGAHTARTDADGTFRPRFSGGSAATIVPAAQVFDGNVDSAMFKDRIVLIGASLQGLGDIHMTPRGEPEIGTAINARLIASFLAAKTLWRPGWARVLELLALLLAGGSNLLLFRHLPDRVFAAQGLGMALILAGASYWAFLSSGLLLDWIWPVSGLLAVQIGGLSARAREAKRARRDDEAAMRAAAREIEAAREIVGRAMNGAKLAMLGELATVLAHELRQPIATISLAAENAEMSLEDDAIDISDARVRLRRIVAQAERAKSIIDHLRVFGRSDAGLMEPVDLAAAAKDALSLVEPALRQDGVRASVVLAPDLPRAMGQKVLLEQVLVNLFVNARDAMRTTPSGQREVRLTIVATTTGTGRGGVSVQISDSGPGIPPDVLPRLFEPFFTTKAAGDGTGLGLSISQRIVQSLGGTIAARNLEAGGAVFEVSLPAVTPPPAV